MMQIGIASTMSTPRREATIRPPLHSRIGMSETRNTTAFADIYLPRFVANQAAKLSIL